MNKNFQKILIFVVIFLVIFGVIFAFFFLNKGKDSQDLMAPKEGAQEETNSNATSTASEQRIEDVALLAESLGEGTGETDLKICAEISDSYMEDMCYDRIAGNELDPEICDNIANDSTKQICKLKVYKAKAFAEKDPEICYQLETEGLINNCLKTVVSSNLCSDEECLNEFYNNPGNYDTDGDGLTDLEEKYLYKTDPNKSDSDGDGYSDGEEVSGGYNPLGEGKLQ